MKRHAVTPIASASREAAPSPRALSPGDLTEAVPLHDALCGIGELLQLPRKMPTAPTGVPIIHDGGGSHTRSRNTKTLGMPAIPDPANAYAAARRAERRWITIGAIFGSSMLAMLFLMPTTDARRDPMPTALRTEWRTPHPSYAHTAITFTDSTVVIGTRDLASDTPDHELRAAHVITGLIADRRSDAIELVVRYLVDGEPDQIEARLSTGSVPTLTFSRPEGLVWYPVRASLPVTTAPTLPPS